MVNDQSWSDLTSSCGTDAVARIYQANEQPCPIHSYLCLFHLFSQISLVFVHPPEVGCDRDARYSLLTYIVSFS